jgi:hypothetical protein
MPSAAVERASRTKPRKQLLAAIERGSKLQSVLKDADALALWAEKKSGSARPKNPLNLEYQH